MGLPTLPVGFLVLSFKFFRVRCLACSDACLLHRLRDGCIPTRSIPSSHWQPKVVPWKKKKNKKNSFKKELYRKRDLTPPLLPHQIVRFGRFGPFFLHKILTQKKKDQEQEQEEDQEQDQDQEEGETKKEERPRRRRDQEGETNVPKNGAWPSRNRSFRAPSADWMEAFFWRISTSPSPWARLFVLWGPFGSISKVNCSLLNSFT